MKHKLEAGKILTSELDSEPQTWTWIHELILSKSIAILTEWGGDLPIISKPNPTIKKY